MLLASNNIKNNNLFEKKIVSEFFKNNSLYTDFVGI